MTFSVTERVCGEKRIREWVCLCWCWFLSFFFLLTMCFSTPFMRLLMQITNEISHNKSTTFDVNVGQCYCQCVKYYCSENAFLLSMASSLFVSTLIFDDYCIIVVNEKPIARYAFIIHLVNCLYLYLCVSVSLLLCACHFILFYFFYAETCRCGTVYRLCWFSFRSH